MPDYTQGKIYRLTCIILGLVYYGSTVQTLKTRIREHRANYNTWLRDNTKDYCASFELFQAGDVEIELVIDCPCESKRELQEVEQTFIENDDCCNKHRAFRTQEERKEQNRKARIKNNQTEKRKEYMKEYCKTEEYKEWKRAYMKEYRQKNKIKTIE